MGTFYWLIAGRAIIDVHNGLEFGKDEVFFVAVEAVKLTQGQVVFHGADVTSNGIAALLAHGFDALLYVV